MKKPLNPLFRDQAGEPFKGSVVGLLHLLRKTACGKLAHLHMVTDAVAAETLA
jgi:hypothetical protein